MAKKNNLWVFVSMSLIGAVSQASNSGAPVEAEVEGGDKVVVQQLADKTVSLTFKDGSELLLTRDQLNQIKALKLNERPKFERGSPCVAIRIRDQE